MISKIAVIESHIPIGSHVWHFTHIRENVKIGQKTTIGSHCYIDAGVKIGDNCKIQSGCMIYKESQIGNGVFIGPGCLIINDKNPKAINENFELIKDGDWICDSVRIDDGASVGAGAIIMPGVHIGKFATIGAGSVVTKNIPDYGKVLGVPAKNY